MRKGWARELEIGHRCIQRTTMTSTMLLLRQLKSVACTQKKKQKSPVLIELVSTKTCSELSVFFPKSEYQGKAWKCFQITDIIAKYYIKSKVSEVSTGGFGNLSSSVYSPSDLKSFQHCVLPFRWCSTLAAFPEGFSWPTIIALKSTAISVEYS